MLTFSSIRFRSEEYTSEVRMDQMENCLAWEKRLLDLKLHNEEDEKLRLQEENEALHRQLSHNEEAVKRFEGELSFEGKLVQSLEEKVSFLESKSKELAHDFENSKYNIKNLEDHLLFMEEKISNENKELKFEKCLLMQDKEHLNEEKIQLEEKEIKVNYRLDQIEIREDEILSDKHILQQEIVGLRRENKILSDKNESLERLHQEEVNHLRLENKALKEKFNKLSLKSSESKNGERILVKNENLIPHKKTTFMKTNVIRHVFKRFCIQTALRSVYEIIIYLV